MSMLGRQVKELRALAGGLRKLYENGTNLTRVQVAGMTTAVEVMSEAADTIESLRDSLMASEAALNKRSETCEVEHTYYIDSIGLYEFALSCGHMVNTPTKEPPNHCPDCGLRIEKRESRWANERLLDLP